MLALGTICNKDIHVHFNEIKALKVTKSPCQQYDSTAPQFKFSNTILQHQDSMAD